MIDHISIAVQDLEKATHFYDDVLGALDYERLVTRESTVGYGKKYPEFWLNARPDMTPVSGDTGVHICLRCKDKSMVTAFHKKALAKGGCNDGEPGPRQAAMTTYFGAFIKDLDGNKIEAVCFPG